MRSSQLTNSEGTRYKWNINANRDELDVIKNSVDRQSPTMPPPTTKRSYEEGMDGEDKEHYECSLEKKRNKVNLEKLIILFWMNCLLPNLQSKMHAIEEKQVQMLNDLIGGGDDFQTRMVKEQRKAGKGLWVKLITNNR
nr:2281_t:CDS:2 [Entrophospora candida]